MIRPSSARRRVLGRAATAVASLALLTAGPSTAAAQGQVDAGRQVFEANCAMCHGGDASGMMGGGMMGGGWSTFAAGLLAGLLVAVLAAGVVWLVRGGSGDPSRGAARQELDRRYAVGELSREEYLQRRDDLG